LTVWGTHIEVETAHFLSYIAYAWGSKGYQFRMLAHRTISSSVTFSQCDVTVLEELVCRFRSEHFKIIPAPKDLFFGYASVEDLNNSCLLSVIDLAYSFRRYLDLLKCSGCKSAMARSGGEMFTGAPSRLHQCLEFFKSRSLCGVATCSWIQECQPERF
jgi:hypothetical protein